jgi:hypothetical protein
VLVIGYPRGFFDTFNKLLILKTGVLNTSIGIRFDGLDAFLLDFKYYPGSSGSLIISKPSRLAYDKDGRLESNTVPQYLFLGVYQEEQVRNDVAPESADLGLGWYYYNVAEAISNVLLCQARRGQYKNNRWTSMPLPSYRSFRTGTLTSTEGYSSLRSE